MTKLILTFTENKKTGHVDIGFKHTKGKSKPLDPRDKDPETQMCVQVSTTLRMIIEQMFKDEEEMMKGWDRIECASKEES